MRWFALYLRSRSAPVALAAAAGSALALWALGATIDDPQAEDAFALLAVLAGATATAPGLAGADPDLERTGAIAWPPRRTAHLVLAGATILGIVAATALTDTGSLARNVTGMIGLVALGAAFLGASRAWFLPLSWTLLTIAFTLPEGSPPTEPTYKVVLTWMLQPLETTSATLTAVLLGATGILAYTIRGARR